MKGANILIIEDDPIYQRIITKAILNENANIAGSANTIDEAIVLLDAINFDIALVDIYLGDHSSGIILGKLINQKFNKPFIFISGTDEPSILEAALTANCSCYLTKPFTLDSLIQNIKNILNQKNSISNNNNINISEVKIDDSSNEFFFAKSGKLLKRIEWADVVCLRSDRNYTKVITKADELYMIRCSLHIALTHIIPLKLQSNFVQINRGEILQVKYIKEFSNNTVVINSKEFDISDTYIKNVKLKLNIIL